MLRRALAVLLVGLVIGLAVACLEAFGQPPAGFGRDMGLPPGPRQRVAADSNEFALRLYQQVRGDQKNLIVSPYSLSSALAMTYAGATGETKRQMAKALAFYLPDAQLHPAFAELQRAIVTRGQVPAGRPQRPFVLHIANALWKQPGQALLRNYVRTIEMYYGGGVQEVSFTYPERARGAINQWVSQQTEGKIPDLFPPGVLDANTRLVLTNAIYFSAAWQYPFPKGNTAPGPFTLLSREKISTDMMQQTFTTRYGKGPGYEVVELPYEGLGFAMDVIVPEAGTFNAFEQSLTTDKLNAVLGSLRRGRVDLTLPKFGYGSQLSLARTLSAMGMKDAFDTKKADFAGMDGRRDLFIQAVLHKALIRVDEEGTEAAAATGVAMGVTALPPSAVTTMKVDRPFLYLIREQQTRAILFLGRVLDPRG